jgi:4-alpha-glucanotransferase
MNQPGVMNDRNWTWRFRWEQLTQGRREKLRAITEQARRLTHALPHPV